MTSKKPNGCGNPRLDFSNGAVILFKCNAEKRPRSMFCRHYEDDKCGNFACVHLAAGNIHDLVSGIKDNCGSKSAIMDRLHVCGIGTRDELGAAIMSTFKSHTDRLASEVFDGGAEYNPDG